MFFVVSGEGGHLFKYDPQNWNLEMLVFEERGSQSTQPKTSRSKGENQQQTQPTLGFEPGPYWWEASALTSAPPFFSVISQDILLFFYSFKLDFFVAHLPQHI